MGEAASVPLVGLTVWQALVEQRTCSDREAINRAVSEREVGAADASPAAPKRAVAARHAVGSDQAHMVRWLCSHAHRI
jgi:hypothetical protein